MIWWFEHESSQITHHSKKKWLGHREILLWTPGKGQLPPIHKLLGPENRKDDQVRHAKQIDRTSGGWKSGSNHFQSIYPKSAGKCRKVKSFFWRCWAKVSWLKKLFQPKLIIHWLGGAVRRPWSRLHIAQGSPAELESEYPIIEKPWLIAFNSI